MRIPGLRGLPAGEVARHTWREFQKDDMWTFAAALAYHALFALFPFLLFLVAAFSFLDAPELFEWLLDQSRRFLPSDAQATVAEVVGEVRGQREGGLLSLGIVGAVWIASGGVRSTMHALNVAYEVAEGRRWWKRYLVSVAYTLALAVLVMLATTLMVLGPRATAWVLARLGAGEGLVDALHWLRVPLSLLLAWGAIVLVYFAAPNVRQRLSLVLPGAVLAVVLWAAVSLGFQLYVSRFSRYSVTYGSIGAVVMLLAYFYLSSLVLLLGAELNAAIQHRAPDLPTPEPAERPPPGSEG
jgi:membrane protein